MIETFRQYFEGTFDNKMQAMSYPTMFAMIELLHVPYDENKYRCIQRYFVDKNEYRNTIISISEEDSKIIVKNFKENSDTKELTYLEGCDIVFNRIGDEFHGKNLCKTCFVSWSGKETYLQTVSILGNGYYNVIDRGYDINTNEHIWGSFNGQFQFVKNL